MLIGPIRFKDAKGKCRKSPEKHLIALFAAKDAESVV
jgi:hypothetical protein